MERVKGVDALRGCLACGVMLYHLLSWTKPRFYTLNSELLNTLATSFVEMFFVISGFSLFYVYFNRMKTKNCVVFFFIRRFFRIAPLYYFLLLLVIVIKIYAQYNGLEVNRPLSTELIVSNFTFWFGLHQPSDSLLVGGWSIGVEMAFYLMFPILIFCVRTTMAGIMAFLLSCVVLFVYSATAINKDISISAQWESYAYAITHLPYFVGGIMLFFVYKSYVGINRIRKIGALIAVLVCITAAILLGSVSSYADPLIGNIRYIWIFLCLCLVLAFAFWGANTVFLLKLGDLSYSIYLGHFFVFLIVNAFISSAWLIVLLSVIGTYFCSTITYKYIEIPMSNLGKKAVKKMT